MQCPAGSASVGGSMKLDTDPKVDIAFKKLFGSEDLAPLLIHLLHAVIQPARPITGLEITQAQSEKDAPLDKLVIGDIRARDQGHRQFHVEMQWLVPGFFRKRLLYYWSKFNPQQLRAGESYLTLRPTFSICFTNQVVFPNVEDYHLVFRLLEVKRALLLCDDLEIHLIELPKFTKTAEQLSSDLDRWCYFLRYGAELGPEQLPPSLDVPEIRRAMEVLKVFTQEERERYAYEMREMAERDKISLEEEYREGK
jgi:predicted transposase/invertase (TIGR01784 family)